MAARVDNAEITLTITRDSDGSTVGQVTQQLSGGMNEAWDTFAFNEPYVTVTPEETYSLNLLANEDQTRICYTANNYARGYYRTVPDTDWLFKIYGISVSTPSDPAATNQTPSTTTPATSSTISAPNNLQATYIDPLKVKLTWTKSTSTNITGYNIYRSLNKNDLVKIGSVDKNTAEFQDQVGLEHGKTYYYYVRAYTGTLESANSNEAFASVPTAVTATQNSTAAKPWYKKYLLYLIIGGVVLISGLAVLIYFLIKRKKSKLANKDNHLH